MRLLTQYPTPQRYHSLGKRATPLSKALTVFEDKKAISPTVAAHSEMVNILTTVLQSLGAYMYNIGQKCASRVTGIEPPNYIRTAISCSKRHL